MKKLLIAIVALLYIGSSTGATVHLHYCMGKLADWGIGHDKSENCSQCGMEKTDKKDNGCCKDEHKFIKNITDQKIAESGLQLTQLMAVTQQVSFEILPVNFPSLTDGKNLSHGPPLDNWVTLYILHRTFRI